MVADMHRTLFQGGIYLYPADNKQKEGKMKLLFECFPMAYIMEKAGGAAINNKCERVLAIKPTTLHQKCGLIIGSPQDVKDADECLKKHK
jgi:fructose-1,6-bisphosphatase I